jgi:small-conductance mechanosensitive channel
LFVVDSSSNVVQAIVLAVVWIAVIVGVRAGLRFGFGRYERRLAEQDPAVAARRRTTFSFLLRVAIAVVVLIGVWSVLSVFPATEEVAKAFLASSAVLALIAGVALSTPLGNLGSGVLLAFTQPVRLGDRISIGEHTGVVESISLSYTSLVTDEGRHVFVPNQTMVSTMLVNRSVGDPRRVITVRLPVAIDAALPDARRLALEAAETADGTNRLALKAQVAEITERVVWLEVSGFAPRSVDVSELSSGIRERALGALAKAKLLPAPS